MQIEGNLEPFFRTNFEILDLYIFNTSKNKKEWPHRVKLGVM